MFKKWKLSYWCAIGVLWNWLHYVQIFPLKTLFSEWEIIQTILFFLFVLIITHVAVDDVYDEIKTCSQHRVPEKAQILKISFIIHVKSILSWFSQLLFTGNQSPQFIFLFSSCEKLFPLHAYCFRKSGFFFKLLFWKKK